MINEKNLAKPAISLNSLLRAVIEIESRSLHPLSNQIIDKCKKYLEKTKSNQDINDLKVECRIEQVKLIKGGISAILRYNKFEKIKTFEHVYNIVISNEQKSFEYEKSDTKYAITVHLDDQPMLRFRFKDQIKSEIGLLLNYCQEKCIKIVILSGDRTENVLETVELAKRIYKKHFNDFPSIHCVGNASAGDKHALVTRLQKLGTVCYIGDGLNDQSGINQSDLGIKLGQNGTVGHFQIDSDKKDLLSYKKPQNRYDFEPFNSILNLFDVLEKNIFEQNILFTCSVFFNLLLFIFAFCYAMTGRIIQEDWACVGMFFTTVSMLVVFLVLYSKN
ncbi:ATPase [Pseudoloma neurophilia]|uniref:ATPase n=1 Tax=Pseudoloma neurophilia TaxID=146866 RepID=A0A0R0M260_9MICR|nr:ATPase [Pseudoloma neurophilia]